MPISSYPRVTVQGTGTAQNTQNGSALMVVNPSTGKYEAATAATFGGGGGGGDATAANQSTQITEAQSANTYLSEIQLNTTGVATEANQSTQITEAQNTNNFLQVLQDYLIYDGNPNAYSLNEIRLTNETIRDSLTAYGTPAAEYLNSIQNNTTGLATSSNQTNQQTTLNDILTKLGDIYNLLNNGTAKVQLYDSGGAAIGTTAGRLNVDTGA